MNKTDRFKIKPARMAEAIEKFWFRRFRWLYFLLYVPAILVLAFVIWDNSVRDREWSQERKQQYVLESGQRGRDFQEDMFFQVIERVKKGDQIFGSSASDTKNIFRSKN